MTGPTGFAAQAHRADDVESSARCSGALRGSAGGSQSVATPSGVKGHCGTPARKVTRWAGSSLASPSGLRVLVRPSGVP